MTKSLWVGIGVVCVLAGCESQVCTPGTSVACVGAGGCAGGQVCLADGTGYGACDCGGMTDAGTDTGTDPDGGVTDVPMTDAPMTDAPVACDPITQAGCASGERCAYVPSTMMRECVAGAGIAVGAACEPPADGAAEACAAGARCIDGRCATLCLVAGDSRCASTEACVAYVEIVGADRDDVGACQLSCDLVTQLRGDGTSCPARQACYGGFRPDTTTLVCGPSTATRMHGDEVTGTVYTNSCAAGHMVLNDASGTPRCAAFCRPAETSTASPSMASGVAPYGCTGAAAGNDCVYLWSRIAMSPPDARLADVGVCFDRTGRMLDDDGDGTPETPWPSCATRSNVDGPDADDIPEHTELGCAPFPG